MVSVRGSRFRNICELLKDNGVKLLRLDKPGDSFFGLSVGCCGVGPALVVNTWDRISGERWIFTAAHELGHLLLHPSEYLRDAAAGSQDAEREADAFVSEFLMPEKAFRPEWHATRGPAGHYVSLGRTTEVLKLTQMEMRQLTRGWAG